MTTRSLQWAFLAPVLPPALRDVGEPRPERTLPGPSTKEGPDDEQTAARDAQLVTVIGHALLEVLTDRRPVWQLARWIAPDSLDQLAAAIRTGRWTQARLLSARASRTGADKLLGRVRFDCDGRALTGCLRIQLGEDGWRCTHFTLLLPGGRVRTDV